MNADEISRLLPLRDRCRVAVVGDVMLDVYTWGIVERISPEAPVPVVAVSHETSSPGGAANAAVCVASLGAAATLLGTVGPDQRADELARHLAERGVAMRCHRSASEATITKHRIWSGGQQLLRLDTEHAPPAGAAVERLRASFDPGEFDAILVSDYGKGVIDEQSSGWLIAAAAEASVPVVIDPKSVDFRLYRGCTVIKPNEKESRAAFRFRHGREGSIEEIGAYLTAEIARHAVITRGAEGLDLFGPDGHRHVPVHRQNVYDVTGAGDVVAAVFAVGAAAQWDLHATCRLANAAARVSVSRVGTGGVTAAEMIDAVEPDE